MQLLKMCVLGLCLRRLPSRGLAGGEMQQADGWRGGGVERERGAAYQPEPGAATGPATRFPFQDQTHVPVQEAATSTANDSSENLAALIHDARNMVSAIDLYCDLLEEPGVLSAAFRHYAEELRLIGGASRRLLEKLAVVEGVGMVALPVDALYSSNVLSPQADGLGTERKAADIPAAAMGASSAFRRPSGASLGIVNDTWRERTALPVTRMTIPAGQPITGLAQELRANLTLLSALAGPAIATNLSISGGELPVAMTGDDFTRVLVNLTRNAAEAMPGGGHLQITLAESAESLSVSFADSGPGITEAALETIFSPGFSTHIRPKNATRAAQEDASLMDADAWPVRHRGLGLSIVRSLVSAAGGRVWAANAAHPPDFADSITPDSIHLAEHSTGASRWPGEEVEGAIDFAAPQGAVITIEFPIRGAPAVT